MSAWDEVDEWVKKQPGAMRGGGPTPKTKSDRTDFTARAEQRIARGVHPLNGRALLKEPCGKTCGGCANLLTKTHRNTFFKCSLYGDTNGPATDVRKKWPACELWRKP